MSVNRLIGKCPYCNTTHIREHLLPLIEIRCCNTPTVLRAIRGSSSAKKCDARCTAATGSHCDCQCKGRNHGSRYELASYDSAR